MNSAYLVALITSAGIYAIFALGLNLQWGYTGLINFGHVAFMTLGAYVTALLSRNGIPTIVAVIVGMGSAALLGLAIGMTTLRLREDYLAIVTIGVSELIRIVANNEDQITNGPNGVQGYPLPLDVSENLAISISAIAVLTLLAIFAVWRLQKSLRQQWKESKTIVGKSYQPTKRASVFIWGAIAAVLIIVAYINGAVELWDYSYNAGLMVLVLLVLALVYWGLEFLGRSPWGRILKAIREDEEIPRALGKNIFWYKLQAFMLGGAIAGISGSFLAWQLTLIYPNNFEPLITFHAWIIVVVGGAGNNAGTILGAVIFWAYNELTRSDVFKQLMFNDSQLGALRIMVIGLILMVITIWRPQGILGKKEELTLGR
jgi:neutral amino acid transport system permease protein